jgi:hypothetical protein
MLLIVALPDGAGKAGLCRRLVGPLASEPGPSEPVRPEPRNTRKGGWRNALLGASFSRSFPDSLHESCPLQRVSLSRKRLIFRIGTPRNCVAGPPRAVACRRRWGGGAMPDRCDAAALVLISVGGEQTGMPPVSREDDGHFCLGRRRTPRQPYSWILVRSGLHYHR